MAVFETLAIPDCHGSYRQKTSQRRNWHSACVEFIIPKKLARPCVLPLLRKIMDIPPNFGVKQFKKKKEATGFLRQFGFELILRRSDCDVWQTKEEPKVRALMFQNRDGLYVVGQLRWGSADR
jgi:hypothetical protein